MTNHKVYSAIVEAVKEGLYPVENDPLLTVLHARRL